VTVARRSAQRALYGPTTLTVRRRGALGATVTAQLEARHHLSFAAYQDSAWDRFGTLCALNHNILAAGGELRPHPIDGVEILVYVRSGVIEHSGPFGRGVRTVGGEVRLISTGMGIDHGVHNPGIRPAEYVEMRLAVAQSGERPSQRVAAFPKSDQKSAHVLLASGFAEEQPILPMRALAGVSAHRMRNGLRRTLAPGHGRRAYVLCVAGEIQLGAHVVGGGDAVVLLNGQSTEATAQKATEILIVETI